jgi:hypothetical protein
MNRRSFVARTLAGIPIISVVAAARPRPMKGVTLVTVSHDGDQPVPLMVTGTVIVGGKMTTYPSDAPLKLATPASLTVEVESTPAVIRAEGRATVRVVADRQASAQHLLARANRVTIRRRVDPESAANPAGLIEIIGEAARP